MISRLFTLISLGFFFVSCSPDPRWGPPRNGLREPLEWQYRESNRRTSISYDELETRRSELAFAFVAYRPVSFGYGREPGKPRATLQSDGAGELGFVPRHPRGY